MEKVIIKMPYEPDISVNHAYIRGNPKLGKKKHVNSWLTVLRGKLNNALRGNMPETADIEMDLYIVVPQRKGRMPDTTNFQKLIMDVVAQAVGFDDWTFTGHCYPARRAEIREDPYIKVELKW